MTETATANTTPNKKSKKAVTATAPTQPAAAAANPAPTAPSTEATPGTKPERPEQIVITMSEELKVAIQKKCKAERTPVARKVRKMLQDWVDGKLDLDASKVAAAKAEPSA